MAWRHWGSKSHDHLFGRSSRFTGPQTPPSHTNPLSTRVPQYISDRRSFRCTSVPRTIFIQSSKKPRLLEHIPSIWLLAGVGESSASQPVAVSVYVRGAIYSGPCLDFAYYLRLWVVNISDISPSFTQAVRSSPKTSPPSTQMATPSQSGAPGIKRRKVHPRKRVLKKNPPTLRAKVPRVANPNPKR
jgi:hypothetical protein